MYLVDYRSVMLEKYERQKELGLSRDVMGHSVHVGDISPGCRSCLSREGCDSSVFIGAKCVARCPMCYYSIANDDAFEDIQIEIDKYKNFYFNKITDPLYYPSNITYNSHGEPFLYLDAYLQVSENIKKVEEAKGIKIHKRIYTSGGLITDENLDILKKLEIEEVRFHISALGFREDVYDAMRKTKAAGFRVTVEEPAWPLDKDKLMAALPILEEIGISHLNMDEIDITTVNLQKVNDLYPNGRMYKNLNYHLYDEGMVYDIMEEVKNKNFSFSVLDCSSDLCRNRAFRDDRLVDFDMSTLGGMVEYKGEENAHI